MTKPDLLKINIIIFLVVILWGLTSLNSYGQTTAATPTISSNEQKDIQSLKDKIATKVAELREKNNKAISGFIQSISNNTLKIKTSNNDQYNVKIDSQLTKFYQIVGSQKKEINFEQIKKGSYIIATGLINDKTIDANIIYIDELFELGSGKVTEVNRTEYFIRVMTLEKDNVTLDTETFTKQQMVNIKTLNLERVGFSKIKEGDTIHYAIQVTGQEKEPNRFAAQKIVIIPQEYFSK